MLINVFNSATTTVQRLCVILNRAMWECCSLSEDTIPLLRALSAPAQTILSIRPCADRDLLQLCLQHSIERGSVWEPMAQRLWASGGGGITHYELNHFNPFIYELHCFWWMWNWQLGWICLQWCRSYLKATGPTSPCSQCPLSYCN